MTEPRPPVRLGWDAPIPGTWALVGALALVHVATAVIQWRTGRVGLPAALFLEREVWFRVAVGGLHASKAAEEPWRLATSVFLHANALHLLLNLVSLGALGRVLEPWVGGLRLWAWFVVGGLFGSVASVAAGVRLSDGASGGAFALLGVAVVLGWRLRERLEPDERRLLGPILAGFLALNLVLSFALPFIDAAGHLGGLAAGLLLGYRLRVDGAPPWQGLPAARAGDGLVVALVALTCAWGWLA